MPVARARIRDRGATSPEERIRFSSTILPKWARRTRSLDALLPVLYLRGISTGDFQEALSALLGKDAPTLSPAVIARLTATWADEYARWQGRDLPARHSVYIWARLAEGFVRRSRMEGQDEGDGVYLQARMEEQAECMLVLIGATLEGRKEFVGFQVGVRESAQSWCELLVDVKRRGLSVAPKIAVGDGALGFWKALDEVFPGTRHQRCWQHKMANVLNRVPKSLQQAMKADLREIHGAPTRAEAEVAMDAFGEKYGAKYARATECLTKDRAALLAFYDMPAEHWDHLRTTNPIESLFATVRHRTVRTKGGVAGRFRRFAGPLERPRRGALADDGQADGVQTGDGRRENLATAEGREPVAESGGRCHLPGWDRGHRELRSPRRLTTSVTQIPA